MTTDLLTGLNPEQQRAVETTEGPVLVLAGPGSGKTRVLTHRIAHLIRKGADPWTILAVTFTNKAAREMRYRLDSLVEGQAREVMMGTFHSICARILRHHIQHLGYHNSFLIYDTEDQRRLVKQVIAEMNLNDKTYRPNSVHAAISNAKNQGVTPKTFRAQSYWEEIVGRIYERYQSKLQECNALDFDDLMLLTLRLFEEVPTVLEAYQRRWHYIHVDEFQDTNLVQYELVRMLAETHRNVFVVGDIDQCVPPGTRVRTPDGEKRIEQIQAGERVISAAGRGTTTPMLVQKVHSRPYNGPLRKLMLKSGRVLELTPNHMCFARLGTRGDVHYVYLMYREDKGYRIGLCVGARPFRAGRTDLSSGLAVRINQEHADKAWILRVCDSREEATYFEQFFSLTYGIPTTVFHTAGRGPLNLSQESIDRLFQTIDTRARAEEIFGTLGLYQDHPHYRSGTLGDEEHLHRISVHFTAFGGNAPSVAAPWYRHRFALNTKNRVVEQQLITGGMITRAGSRGTWRIERSYKEFERTLDDAQKVANAAGGADVARWARLSLGKKFAF